MTKINIFNIQDSDLANLLMTRYEQDLDLSKEELEHLIKIILKGNHGCLFKLVGLLISNTPQSKKIPTELVDTLIDRVLAPHYLKLNQKDLARLYHESEVLTDAQKQKVLEALKNFISEEAEAEVKAKVKKILKNF